MSGFQSTGIMPFNPDIFTEEDYLSCSITDRPMSEECEQDHRLSDETRAVSNLPGTSVDGLEPIPSTSSATQEMHRVLISPKELRPYPKAGKRKSNRKGRQTMKS